MFGGLAPDVFLASPRGWRLGQGPRDRYFQLTPPWRRQGVRGGLRIQYSRGTYRSRQTTVFNSDWFKGAPLIDRQREFTSSRHGPRERVSNRFLLRRPNGRE